MVRVQGIYCGLGHGGDDPLCKISAIYGPIRDLMLVVSSMPWYSALCTFRFDLLLPRCKGRNHCQERIDPNATSTQTGEDRKEFKAMGMAVCHN